MVIRKKKKYKKFRGKRSYGYGSHKKHRGGGSRGGRGNAGLHKHKWSHTVKYNKDHFGKRGFKPVRRKEDVIINVKKLQDIAKSNKINLTELGYDKVLGSGKIESALEVTAKSFSKRAKEKIEAAGGTVIIDGDEKTGIDDKKVEKTDIKERAA